MDGDEEQVDAAKDANADGLPDLRQTKHEDMDVQVQRELTGSSFFLARGSKTHYSKIHFRSQGIPRDVATPPEATSSSAAVSEGVAPVTGQTQAIDGGQAARLKPQPKTSVLGKLLGLFGR